MALDRVGKPKLAGKRRILWYDDDPDNEPLLRRLAGESRDEIIVATTFAEALSLAHGRRFDLYLSHKWQGDGVALDLCRRIRSVNQLTPILLYSRRVYEADREEMAKAGAQGYVPTPASLEELERAVSQVLDGPTDQVAVAGQLKF